MSSWARQSRLIGAASRQALRYPLRSLLVAGCAAIGVAGAITAVNYASGGRQQVLAQIQRLGTNVVNVTAQQSRGVAGRARTGSIVTTLREADLVALRRELPDIVRASPVASASLRVKGAGQSKVAGIVGVEPDWFLIRNWGVADGQLFDDVDLRRSARVVVLGAALAHDLFGANSPLGERLFVNRVPFEVVGVLRERGPGLDAVNEDQQAYVPLTAAMRRLMNVDHYAALVLEIDDWTAMDRTAAQVETVMRERHRARAGQDEDFKVQNQKTLVDTQLQASAQLGFFVRWIGFSALLVAGLGVLAMAWIAVRDRTREIGTRRALGATRRDVFVQFAWEAVALAALGATAGLVLGWLASRLVAARAGLPFVFDAGTALGALAAALVLNVLFASWPALRAARLDPIRALRHE
jgi:putative ABC transport system permease protein